MERKVSPKSESSLILLVVSFAHHQTTDKQMFVWRAMSDCLCWRMFVDICLDSKYSPQLAKDVHAK